MILTVAECMTQQHQLLEMTTMMAELASGWPPQPLSNTSIRFVIICLAAALRHIN